jgi:hypothetical protein
VPYQFDDSIKICASKIELAQFKLQEKSEKKLTDSSQQGPSAVTLIKEIFGSHLVIFISFSTVKAYLDTVWYFNVYSIQKSQEEGESSIYHNGLVLGTVSMVSFFLSGFVSKYFDSFKA